MKPANSDRNIEGIININININTSDKLINDIYNLTVLPVPNMKLIMKGGSANTKKQLGGNKNTDNKRNKRKNKKKTLKK